MKNNKTNSYRHTLKYTSLFGGVQGLNILIGLVRNKLVALILGPAGMGLVSLYNSTITLISTATTMGMSMSGVKKVSEIFDEAEHSTRLSETVRLVRSLSLLMAILGMAVCTLFSSVLSRLTFGDYNHVWGFVALSPMVGMMAVITGELAVMKGVRMLKPLASISIFNVIAAVFISIPLFYVYGMAGIVPSFILLTLSQFLFTLRYSCRIFPWRVSLRYKFLRRGNSLIKLGVAFVMAGVFGTGADFLIRLFLNNTGSLDTVGLYNAGYMMTMVYGGLVFSAMETDYFPRLSAIPSADVAGMNDVVNKQIEVSLLLISPMLTMFVTFLPIIIPLLFSSKFVAVVAMAQVMALALFLRALKLPLSYIALAKSDSRSFLILEGLYAVIVFVLICFMFMGFGLIGAGYAILLTAVIDFVVLSVYTYYKYGYKMSRGVFRLSVVMLPLGGLSYIASQTLSGPAYWIVGILISLVSLAVSIYVLHRKTHLVSAFKKKIVQKFGM